MLLIIFGIVVGGCMLVTVIALPIILARDDTSSSGMYE
jgi:hypothetical protein